INARDTLTLDDSSIFSNVRGTGNAGNIIINATNSISLEDGNIQSQVLEEAIGNAGNIEIKTSHLELNNSSLIGGQTSGQGNAGSLTISAENTITINSGSSLRSLVGSGGKGKAGDITINTGILNVETVEGTSENRSLIFSNKGVKQLTKND
ncbi:MAG: hypothetical protein QNJ55_34255, partial [Xenococcus sp. MO_188.B8]|nr:hypothetical protein [Xenococcus sp. MO_188.B8]